jgi:predicted transcriptional regulator
MRSGETTVVRRPTGSLEAEVLAALWATGAGATPGEVHQAMGAGLAYTTVMTTLSRLWKKGLVDRERRGRAYAYRPRLTEAQLAAERMLRHLDQVDDREAALLTFVDTLGEHDATALRRIVTQLSDPA